MITKPNFRVMSRYLASRFTEREKRKVEVWISLNAKNKEFFDNLRNIWEMSSRVGGEWDFARPIQRLSAMIKKTDASSSRNGDFRLYRIAAKPSFASISTNPIFQVAAVFVALVGLLFAVYNLKEKALEKQFEERQKSFAIEEASTKPGQQATFKFADGTKVVLNSASRLKYSNDPEGSRYVFLDGEAYFDVVHSDAHPFVVHAGNKTVKDVGTKFDVKAWSDDDNMQVVVVEGIVSVQPKGKNEKDILVYHNQYCVVNDGGIVLPPTYTDVSRGIDWMNGKLVFHDAPMREVVKQIQRSYGIRCLVADTAILSKKITTSFEKQDPPKQVLDVIALSLNLTYKMSRDSVLFESSRMLFPNGSTKGTVRDIREKKSENKQINVNDTSYKKGGFDN